MTPELRQLLQREGPLPLARVMALAAQHYYAHHQPFGQAGDFITAPEISQMFGELLGLWLADLWQRAGAPARVILAELGPGRGTLLADALRAIGRAAPAFRAAIRLHLVETSTQLRAVQAERLPDATWHREFIEIPDDAPLLLVANEFLDALPLTQFERLADGWALRRVQADARFDTSVGANLAFLPPELVQAPVGSVYERNFASEQVALAVARRLADTGGAALFIDYGHEGPALGDTLQAIHHGQFAEPLPTLGEADISAHVDFARLREVAAPQARVFGPMAQGQFLLALGLRARADALKAGADLATSARIEAALARLTSPAAMGRLFQAMALVGRDWPAPAGLAGAE